MAEAHHIANLGSLVSAAEQLRARALAAMQHDPAAPAAPEALATFNATLRAAHEACATDHRGDLTDPPLGAGATVSQLHRAAGLLEHALLVRLAEARLRAREDEARPPPA